MVVYIDWNENGSFGDLDEQYFNVPAKFVGGTGAAIALNGTTAIPDGVTLANKRMNQI